MINAAFCILGLVWFCLFWFFYGRKILAFWQRAGKEDMGSIIVEAAFVFPIFLLLVLGGFDLLWAEVAKADLNFITQQAVVCLEKTGCDANAYIANNAPSLGLDPTKLIAVVSVNTVTTTYRYAPVGPDFPHITLTATATAPQ